VIHCSMRFLTVSSALWLAVLVAPRPLMAAAPSLPRGVSLHPTPAGPVLVDEHGVMLYRLDIDRYREKFRQKSADPQKSVDAYRCGDACRQLWVPIVPARDFQAGGDWGQIELVDGTHQLTYRTDPLYRYAADSFTAAAQLDIYPPYVASYASPPVRMVDGVPIVSLYWHSVVYSPPPPDVAAPSGIAATWSDGSYVFSTSEGHRLYQKTRGTNCTNACPHFTPLVAPLAAVPLGPWRPIESASGEMFWQYKGQTVYVRDGDPGVDLSQVPWRPLEVYP
jgi:predicted lipoprotein with Yx(FWY)xxD motif